MSVRHELAQAYAEVFDTKRETLLDEESSLFLILNAGTEEETELEIDYGWWPERQQRFGEVNSIRLIKVTERDELTSEVMSTADRLRLNGVVHTFNFDPPIEDVWWTLYATEMKAGGFR